MAMDVAAFPAVLIEPFPRKKEAESQALGQSPFQRFDGTLNFEQLALIMRHLPIDITFVDEHNRVTYYNETTNRLFPARLRLSAKRRIMPPRKSVHVVKTIIESFRWGLPTKLGLDRIQKPLYLYRLLCFKR